MINQPGISSITVGGVTQYGGSIELSVPGATIDPGTGEIIIPVATEIQSQTFILTNTDITNKYILINVAPVNRNTTDIEVMGMGPMYQGPDFENTADDGGKRISWAGKILESLLLSGDTVIVYYY